MPLLTKSKYMTGQQCLRLLWHSTRKLLPEKTIAEKQKLSQGHEFEECAHKLFPDAVNLADIDFEDNLKKTKELIEQRKTIFEAGIKVDDLFLRADVFEPVGDGWNLYEIKASTKQKPEHIPDLAFQKFVCEKAGLNIKKCFVIFLNKEFVKKGDIDSKELATIEEVTEKVDLIDDVEKNAKLYLEIMNQEKTPDITISKNCNKPYPCDIKYDCWNTLPKNNVLHLTNWRVYWKLFDEGIIDLKDVPKDTKLTPKDQTILEGETENKIMISKEHIKHFLDSLNYPLCHLDFETFDTAVPIFDKSRPWQKMPFQYSVHIQPENGEIVHYEYLAQGDEDPRLKLLESLKEHTKNSGSVIVFNKSFEIGVLTKLAEDFPEHKEWIQDVLSRIIDLAVPFQSFYYYNPEQKGSYSIKKVLPAITGKSYSELEINNGGDASALYFYSHIKKEIDNKEKIRENLIKYCCLDTEGMVWIVNELKNFRCS
tara:strand:- start:4718 stop:6163 length:1446 start_codon:yes stop_codon:yes gene_type:complete